MQESKVCAQMWTAVSINVEGKSSICCNMTSLEPQNESVCEIPASDFLHTKKVIEIRNQMLNGEEAKECELCYSREALGNSSIRHYKNDLFFRQNEVETFDTEAVEIHNMELQLGNLCQLRCIICSPERSIKIQGFSDFNHTKFNTIPIRRHDYYDWHEDESIILKLAEQCNQAKELFLNGGEPLLVKAHNQLLSKLIELDYAKDISLKYATNGLLIRQEHVDLRKHFKHIELSLSIDDIGDRYHFVRYPGNWDKLKEKLDFVKMIHEQKMLNEKSFITIYVVINLLNYLYIDEFIDYFSENYPFIYLILSTIQYPDQLSPFNLPSDLKKQIGLSAIDKIRKHNLDSRMEVEIQMIMDSTDNPKLLDDGIEFVNNFAEYYKLDLPNTFSRLRPLL